MRPSPSNTEQPTEDAEMSFCLATIPQKHEHDIDIQSVSHALVQATLDSLPVSPDGVSTVKGPRLEVTKVDSHTADIKIIHGFRAHFRSSMKKHGSDDATFENCLVQSPGEQMRKRVMRRGSMSFSDLSELENGPCDVLGIKQRCQWLIDPAEIQLGRRIAVGGFAEVFIGQYEGTIVAVKRMFEHDALAIEQFCKEVSILAKLRHPNLILFMGYCLTPELSIVSEFMQKGSLYGIISTKNGVPLSKGHTEIVAVSVARAMAYLHTRDPPILHLDLKSPNILIDDAWHVKITDFGLSRFRNRTLVSGNSGGHGTPHWMAPEMIRGERIDDKGDVFSYGVILWECLTGEIPWGQLNPVQVMAAVGFKNRRLPRPQSSDTFLVTLMEECFEEDPQKRPSFTEILRRLDAHYSTAAAKRLAILKLPEESATTDEPATPTLIEPATEKTRKESAGGDLPKLEVKRSVERLAEFEQEFRSRHVLAVGAMASPFKQMAETPFDDEPPSSAQHVHVTDTQSCTTAFGAQEAVSTFAASPFAAFSAMPFVDSAEPPTEHHSTSTPVRHKSLKDQVSAVYDDPAYDATVHNANRVGSYEDREERNEVEWKIKVAAEEATGRDGASSHHVTAPTDSSRPSTGSAQSNDFLDVPAAENNGDALFVPPMSFAPRSQFPTQKSDVE